VPALPLMIEVLSLVSTSLQVGLAGFAHDMGVEEVEGIGVVVVVLCGRGNVGTTRPPALLGSELLSIAQSYQAWASMHRRLR
jgi:hypothetical protein